MRTTARTTRAAQLIAVTCATVVAVAISGPAFAHIDATATETGELTSVTFSFTHGCDGSPTETLRIKLPGDTTDVVPQNPSGWTSDVVNGELRWTGGSATDGTEASFTATMKLPNATGDTVFFPTIQGCPEGKENAWIDKSTDPEADNAAPRITLGSAQAAHDNTDGHHASRTPLIIGGVAAVLVLAGIAAFFVIRRRRTV